MLRELRCAQVALCGVCLLAGVVAAFAQGEAPAPQIGVKQVPAMYVAWENRKSPMAHLDQDMARAFQDLWQSCVDTGLHPLGTPILSVDQETPPGDFLDWQAWIPLADKPGEADLTEKAAVRVKAVPAANVAFTYHYGTPFDLQDTFLKLAAWAMGQGFQVAGKVRGVVHVWPGNKDEKYIVTECQMEYTK
jgi:hypothetical protein